MCRNFCPLIRNVHFIEDWSILVILWSQKGCQGLAVEQKAFQKHEKKFLLGIWKKKKNKLLNTECFYDETKLAIDASFFVLMTSFSSFSLRKQNGARSESSDVNFGKPGNASNQRESFQRILLTHICANFTCLKECLNFSSFHS